MKLLIVTPYVAPIYGGPSKTVVELAEAIAQRGVAVDIVTTNANGSSNLQVTIGSWIKERWGRIQYFPRWNWSNYTISLSLTLWLFQHVKDYDLVHIHTVFSYPVLPACWACQVHNVPYIRTPHGMLEPWALSYKAWKKRIYYTLFERNCLRRAHALHALTAIEAKNIRSLNLGTSVVVIPNGVCHQEFELRPNSDEFYKRFLISKHERLILFLGRIDPKKGFDLLAPAFSKVKSQFPQAHLVIAGPDMVGFLPTVKRYFSQANCLESVTFTGMLTGSLKQAALAAATVYILPSYSEGFSMSILEGMAAGLPCVITKQCNFPEAEIASVARVVDADVDAIATALSQCLANPVEAKEMGDRARQFILKNYTWTHIAKRFVDSLKFSPDYRKGNRSKVCIGDR